MPRKGKYPNAYQMHEHSRMMSEEHARTMEEDHPGVARLKVKISFQDPDTGKVTKEQERTYLPNSKAFFEIACPYRECVLGGFNLASLVRSSLREKQTVTDGESTCSGWQDRERVHKHRCMLKAHVTLEVEFASGE